MSEPRAYYNEIDPEAVAALHQLIADNVIMPGDVDSRSIKEVTPDDVRGYTQCHFFAGAGLWSVGARRAGWPDRRPLWSGSCPCQGESLAGKRRGADDPRHLWPDFFRLIRACRPAVIVGEQVAAAAGTHWLDGTCSDLESVLYAARAVNIPACAVDAPHIRQRLYWLAVANADESELRSESPTRQLARHEQDAGTRAGYAVDDRRMDHAESSGGKTGLRETGTHRHGAKSSNSDGRNDVLANAEGQRSGRDEPQRRSERRTADGRPDASSDNAGNARAVGVDLVDANGPRSPFRSIAEDERRDLRNEGQTARATDFGAKRNGSWWADAEWINCHDGKARRAKPGIRMLVDGMAGRIGLWRLAGNSIVPEIAAEILAAFLEDEAEQHFRLSLQGGVFA